MLSITKVVLISTIQQLILISAISSPTRKNYAKVFLNGVKPDNFLFVSAKHYEPFMSGNEIGEFHNGIEYKLLEAIAKKEHLDMAFIEQFDFEQHDFG